MIQTPPNDALSFDLTPGRVMELPPTEWGQLPEIVRHAVTLAQHADGMSYFDALELLKSAQDTPANVRRLERDKTTFAEEVHDLRRENQKLAGHLLSAKVALDRIHVALCDELMTDQSLLDELRALFEDPKLQSLVISLSEHG